MKYFALLVLSLLVLACSPATPDTPSQEVVVENISDAPDEPVVQDTKEVVEEPEETFIVPEPLPNVPLSGVICENEYLQVTLTNTLKDTWSFAPLGFPPPQNKSMARLTVNSRDAWSPDTRYAAEKEYFTTSLQECVTQLQADESITCTIGPIPYRKDTAYTQNSILLTVDNIFEQQSFSCE